MHVASRVGWATVIGSVWGGLIFLIPVLISQFTIYMPGAINNNLWHFNTQSGESGGITGVFSLDIFMAITAMTLFTQAVLENFLTILVYLKDHNNFSNVRSRALKSSFAVSISAIGIICSSIWFLGIRGPEFSILGEVRELEPYEHLWVAVVVLVPVLGAVKAWYAPLLRQSIGGREV